MVQAHIVCLEPRLPSRQMVKGDWWRGGNPPLTHWDPDTSAWMCMLCPCPWDDKHGGGRRHYAMLRQFDLDPDTVTHTQLMETEAAILQETRTGAQDAQAGEECGEEAGGPKQEGEELFVAGLSTLV